MCRLYAFRSSVVSGAHRSLVAAENALARQSERHRDGWGLAYYNERYPQVIRSDKQALADGLFANVSAIVATRTLLAHIRQATAGNVSVLNCHPFQHGPWTFAHNGQVAGYKPDDSSRQTLLAAVAPRFLGSIFGSTDTELCFHIFLSELSRRVPDIYADDITVQDTLASTVATMEQVIRLCPDRDEQDQNRLTFVITNGAVLLAVRYRRPLNYSTYKQRCPERDTCAAYVPSQCEAEVQRGVVKHLIITSEKVADNPNVWVALEDGDYVAVDRAMRFERGRY